MIVNINLWIFEGVINHKYNIVIYPVTEKKMYIGVPSKGKYKLGKYILTFALISFAKEIFSPCNSLI